MQRISKCMNTDYMDQQFEIEGEYVLGNRVDYQSIFPFSIINHCVYSGMMAIIP